MDVRIKKLHKDAVIPVYAKPGDAGLDLVATEKLTETAKQVSYGTGISVEIPYGYVGLVFPRSSVRKYELELSNSVGVIDSGYRGEIQLTFNKTIVGEIYAPSANIYETGDKIGQLVILPYPHINLVEVDELSETERGDGGFGSTGK
jgi:dUTP pyrophosphatase